MNAAPIASTIDLLAAIDLRIKSVQTTTFDLSFNELLDMHENKELNITPDFQRLFQWSEGAQSRFIESLLLGMPVPPIYVIESDEGRYVLIDGLQRISSYLHMRGKLTADHWEPPIKEGDKLRLIDCDIVTELNGKTFEDLGPTLQIRLKRAFVSVKVIKKGSDARFQYHMFKRLNTGGQMLSDQQVRNCTIRLLDAKFNDFIIKLSKMEHFSKCIENVSPERIIAAFDQELVLRFFAFKNNRAAFSHDVADFLSEYMEQVSDPAGRATFGYESEEAAFDKTFKILERTLGGNAFSFANRDGSKLTRGFSVYHFEAFTIGLQPHLSKINLSDNEQIERLTSALNAVKLDRSFIAETTGGGKNSPGPLRNRIGFIERTIDSSI